MEQTIADRFRILHSGRQAKLNRSRVCAGLTVPSVLPPEGWNEEQTLPQPYSSVAAKGVTAMSSRILSALLPLNDTPFFRFALKSGVEATPEIESYLETLSYQVFNKLNGTNLRETIYQALQHAVIVGDVLFIMEDNFTFRIQRLDQFVVQRDVEGNVVEIINLEYHLIDPDATEHLYGSEYGIEKKAGYQTIYCRYLKTDDVWYVRKETQEGDLLEEGEYTVLPMGVLRWYGIAGENYGRSHCEDILGDLQTLESYTKALIEGLAASSTFWLAIDPTGITEIDDIADAPNGSFIAARGGDFSVLSPSQTMNAQISACQAAVETMRREISQSFLMTSSAIPSGDRVTATAVRMIGSELETVLGGAFSSIARDLIEPIVKRAVFLMLESKDIDKRLYSQFFDKNGMLTTQVITGLQALSRDTDLQRLMQMGEMVRNLPEQAYLAFKWDEYARALISSLGFDPRNWVKSEEDIMMQQQQMQQMQMQQQMQTQAGNAVVNTAGAVAQQAATQDLQQTGGQNIQALMQQAGIDPAQLLGGGPSEAIG